MNVPNEFINAIKKYAEENGCPYAEWTNQFLTKDLELKQTTYDVLVCRLTKRYCSKGGCLYWPFEE
jgi:hypothetical protein